MKQEFYLPSADGIHKIHGYWWKPEGKPRAVVQIVHGMIEHIDRYHDFAEYLVRQNIAVIGHDHLGHGGSVSTSEDFGFFAEENGKKLLLKDINHINRRARLQYPGVPCFILGHSMGSFLLRRYITIWGDEIDGVIIMGTGYQPLAAAKLGKGLASLMQAVKGSHYRSGILHRMSIGNYESQFGTCKKPGSWLSRDTERLMRDRGDERCTFRFTVSAYHDLFSLLEDLARQKDFDRIPRSLPVFIMSGMEDPVGNYVKGVLKVYNQFVAMEMDDVKIQLYCDDRHEILNELDRKDVYDDIRDWLDRHIAAEVPESTVVGTGEMC